MKKLLVVLVLVLSVALQAADVNLTANNGMGTSGFNSATGWSDSLAPSAGKTYSTMGYLLRTPSAAGSYTFAGDSLTVGGGVGGGAFLTNGSVNNNSFINKTPGTTTVITVNNLIVDAGYVRDGQGTSDAWTLAGNMYITANGGGLANQCLLNIDSVISGSGNLYLADNGSGEERRQTYIRSALNTYNGSIYLLGTTAARSRMTFVDDSMMNFVIGANGVNNKITVGSGKQGTVNFNGDFSFDLSGASTNLWDSWTIASVTSQTFGSTFNIAGFTAITGALWNKDANGATYQFNENTGVLTVVPEPATMLLLGIGGLILSSKKR